MVVLNTKPLIGLSAFPHFWTALSEAAAQKKCAPSHTKLNWPQAPLPAEWAQPASQPSRQTNKARLAHHLDSSGPMAGMPLPELRFSHIFELGKWRTFNFFHHDINGDALFLMLVVTNLAFVIRKYKFPYNKYNFSHLIQYVWCSLNVLNVYAFLNGQFSIK